MNSEGAKPAGWPWLSSRPSNLKLEAKLDHEAKLMIMINAKAPSKLKLAIEAKLKGLESDAGPKDFER